MNHRSLNKDRAVSQSDPPWWSRNPPLEVLKQDFRNQWATSEKLHPSLTLSMVWSQPQVAIWWIAATRLLQYWLHFSDPWALLGLNRIKNNAAWHTRQSGREPWIQAWGTCFLMRVYMQVWQKKGLFGHGGDFEQSRIKCSVVVAKSSEWEAQRGSGWWRMEQLARYWDHLSTLILTCYDISDPLFHSAEPLAAAQRFLRNHSILFLTRLFPERLYSVWM